MGNAVDKVVNNNNNNNEASEAEKTDQNCPEYAGNGKMDAEKGENSNGKDEAAAAARGEDKQPKTAAREEEKQPKTVARAPAALAAPAAPLASASAAPVPRSRWMFNTDRPTRPARSTEVATTSTSVPTVPNGKGSRRRIVYGREALLKIRNNACAAELEIEVPPELMKLKKPNSPADLLSGEKRRTGTTPTPSSRKENSGSPREDSISLRPHSGNFSSGCTPNLGPNGPLLSRFHPPEEQPKSFFDRDFSRNLRYPPMRMEPPERPDKMRGREERPIRDFENNGNRDGRDRERFARDQDRGFRGGPGRTLPVENGRRSYGEGYHSYGAEEPGGWDRRRPNDQNYRRDYHDRHRVEQEPEWFSEGPTTYNDTIELRGFHDDERQEGHRGEKDNAKKDLKAMLKPEEKNVIPASSVEENKSSKPEETGYQNLDKMLAMDQISNILTTNGLLEHEEPSGSSRFSQLFQRYSETTRQMQEVNGAKKSPSQENVANSTPDEANHGMESGDGRTKTARDIEAVLRNILLTKPLEEQEEVKEDVQAFKKLLDQIVIKGGTPQDSPKTSQNVPKVSTEELSPMSDAIARIANLDPTYHPKPKADIQAFFSNFFAKAKGGESSQASSAPRSGPSSMQGPPRPMLRPQNQATDGFRPMGPPHFAQRPNHGGPEQMKFQQPRPSFTAFEVLNLLPIDMQSLVLGAKLGPDFMKRADVMHIINALNVGEVVLGDIIQQLGHPHNPNNKPILAGVLKLGLNGIIPIPGLVCGPLGLPPHMQNMKLPHPPNTFQQYPHQHHPQFPPHPQFVMHHPNHGGHGPPPMQVPNQGNPHYNYGNHFNGGGHPGF